MPSPSGSGGMMLFLLAAIVVVPAWCEYYTMVNPGVRSTCTPRCSDTSSPGQWRCSDVTDSIGNAKTLCNTFELKDPHICHFHHFSQKEVGQCLAANDAEIVFMGMSNAFGFMSSIFPWFNRADYGTQNPYTWLDDKANDNHRVFGCYYKTDLSDTNILEIHLDSSGLLKWRGGCATFVGSGSGCTINDLLDFAANKTVTTTGAGSKLTYIRAQDRAEMLAGLDGLIYAGRQNKNGWLICNLGNYFPDVTTFRAAMVDFIKKVALQLPNYKMILVGYTFPNKVAINDVMQEIIGTYRGQSGYPSMWYLDTMNMMSAVNHPPFAVDHWIPIFNHVVFQRSLSIICADMPGSECEEQMVGTSNTQYDAGLNWFNMLCRQGNTMTYTSNTGPFPDPPSAVDLSPEAPAVLKCADVDGDGFSGEKSFSLCTQILIVMVRPLDLDNSFLMSGLK